MRLMTIMLAVRTLDEARAALRAGTSIDEQMRIGNDCATIAVRLENELVSEVPDLKLEDVTRIPARTPTGGKS